MKISKDEKYIAIATVITLGVVAVPPAVLGSLTLMIYGNACLLAGVFIMIAATAMEQKNR